TSVPAVAAAAGKLPGASLRLTMTPIWCRASSTAEEAMKSRASRTRLYASRRADRIAKTIETNIAAQAVARPDQVVPTGEIMPCACLSPMVGFGPHSTDPANMPGVRPAARPAEIVHVGGLHEKPGSERTDRGC